MKKFLLSLLVSATAFCGFTSANATTTTRDLGYVGASEPVYPGTGFRNSLSTSSNWSVAVRLTADQLQKYIGASITQIKAGWASQGQQGKDVKIWLRTSYEGDDLVTGKGDFKFGWNTIKYSTPYVIPEDVDELWFGYDVAVPPNDYCISTSVLGGSKQGVNYLINLDMYDESPEEAVSDAVLAAQDGMGMILALATVEFDASTFENRVIASRLACNPLINADKASTALLSINNEGSNEVSSLTLHYECGDLTKDYVLDLPQPIMANKSTKISIPAFALASGEHKLIVSEVNGAPNNIKSEGLIYEALSIPGEVADSYERRSLVEYFVDENEYRSPSYFDDILWPGYEPYSDRISLVCHHLSDQFMIGEGEDMALAIMLSGDNQRNVYCPAMAIDRSLQISNPVTTDNSLTFNTIYPTFVSPLYDEALAIPTFASVAVESDFNLEKYTASIEVNGSIAEGVLPEGENLQLTVYVLEDNVYSDSQEFPGEKGTEKREYYHKAIIRQQPTPIYGDVITEGSGNFTRTYEVEIDPTWKAGDMKVLAVLNRTEKNTVYNRSVINVAEAPLDPANVGMAEIATDCQGVAVSGGSITVNGSTEGVEVYNIGGARVANTSLTTGVYVVRTADTAAKVFVK